MSHKYLDELDLEESNKACIFNTDVVEEDSERRQWYEDQRQTFGFDSRETWSMDFTLVSWLYEHLCWYRDYAPIDLTFYSFEIPRWNTKKCRAYKHKTETVNQGRAIDLILINLTFFMESDITQEDEAYARLYYAMRILAEIIPALWW